MAATTGTEKIETMMQYKCSGGKISVLRTGSIILLVLMTLAFLLEITYHYGSLVVLASLIFSAIPLLLCWIALFRLLRTGKTMTETEYKKSAMRLQQDSVLVMLFTAAALFGTGELLFKGNYTSLELEVGMLVRNIVQILLSLALALLSKHHCHQIEKTY